VVEWNLGIICACAPSLRVLFRSYFKTTLDRSKTGSQSGIKKPFGCCGKGEAAFSLDPPPRAIELKRTLTIESDTPFAQEDDKPYLRESIMTMATFASDDASKRIGIVYQPRRYHQPVAEEPHQEDVEAARPRQDSYDPIATNTGWTKSTASISTECHSCRAKHGQDSGSVQRTFYRPDSSETLAREQRQYEVHDTLSRPPLPFTALPPMPSTGYQARLDTHMRSPQQSPTPGTPTRGDELTTREIPAAEEDPMRPDSVMLAMMGRGRF